MAITKPVPVKRPVPEPQEQLEQKTDLLKPLSERKEKVRMPKPLYLSIGVVLIIMFGVLSGYVAAKMSTSGTVLSKGEDGKGIAKTIGVADVSGKDSAEGILRAGGIDSEGTHHLERPGGDSQNVYLTSSVVPLDDYIDKKIKVWGETFAGQTAGWLMDVIKLEVLE